MLSTVGYQKVVVTKELENRQPDATTVTARLYFTLRFKFMHNVLCFSVMGLECRSKESEDELGQKRDD